MSDLDRRREAMEAKFKVDSELRFKVEMHRNRALGHWAAEKMGMAGDEVDAYVATVVKADFEEVGSDDVVRKIVADFEAKNVAIDADQVQQELERCDDAAREALLP
ncbi:MAG: DUF1476 domain-containing protein [Phycisphaerales bacterium]